MIVDKLPLGFLITLSNSSLFGILTTLLDDNPHICTLHPNRAFFNPHYALANLYQHNSSFLLSYRLIRECSLE